MTITDIKDGAHIIQPDGSRYVFYKKSVHCSDGSCASIIEIVPEPVLPRVVNVIMTSFGSLATVAVAYILVKMYRINRYCQDNGHALDR